MVSEQTLEMVSTEKVGLVAHFFPVLTSYVLLYYKNNFWTNLIFYSSIITFVFIVSYLHAHKITSGTKYNLKITKGFRDEPLKKFALVTMPLPYRNIFAFFSALFMVLYVWTLVYTIINYSLNKNLFFILIIMQISVITIYILMLFFVRKFLKKFYPDKLPSEKKRKGK